MSVRAVKHISWIVTLPLMLVLATLFLGLLIGGVIVWLSGARNRRRARELRFDKTYLEREVIRLKRDVERAKDAAAESSPHVLPPSADNGSGRARSLPAAAAGR